jgi:hypothetical protein
MLKAAWIFGAIVLLVAAPVQTGWADDRYEAVVPVSGRDQVAYRRGLSEALDQVATKALGSPGAASRLVSGVADPERLVQQFAYRQGEGGSTLLWVRFDPRAVEEALRAEGVQAQGPERPVVLVWMVVQDQDHLSLVGADEGSDFQRALMAAAKRRGLPVFLPLLDLEDDSRIQTSDVWAGLGPAVRTASERYHPGAVLLARISASGAGRWGADWTLEAKGEPLQWHTDGTLTEAIDAGVDRAADALAPRQASRRPESGEGREALKVDGIDSFQDFVRAMGYIVSLSPVRHVEPQLVRPGSVTFAVDLQGGRVDLDAALSSGQVLRPVAGNGGEPADYGLVR